MSQIIPYIPVIGAAIVGGIALYIRHKNRTQAAKDTFGVFIREQIAALPQHEVREFYIATKPSIRAGVQRVWHFLTVKNRARLDRLWNEYDQIHAREFDGPGERAMAEVSRELHEMSGEWFKDRYEFQSPHEAVKHYLDEFYKFSA